MRNSLIKYFALSYETRVLGKNIGPTGKYLRAVIPCLIAMFISICLSLYTENGFLLLLIWAIFSIPVYYGFPWFGIGYFGKNPITYAELRSKEQKWQMLNKLPGIGIKDKSYPEGFRYQEEYKKLKIWHDAKFNGKKNVNVVLGLLPFIITGIGVYIALSIFFSGHGGY